MYVYVHFMYICIPICTCNHVHVHVHVYTYMRINIYMYICTCTYKCNVQCTCIVAVYTCQEYTTYMYMHRSDARYKANVQTGLSPCINHLTMYEHVFASVYKCICLMQTGVNYTEPYTLHLICTVHVHVHLTYMYTHTI